MKLACKDWRAWHLGSERHGQQAISERTKFPMQNGLSDLSPPRGEPTGHYGYPRTGYHMNVEVNRNRQVSETGAAEQLAIVHRLFELTSRESLRRCSGPPFCGQAALFDNPSFDVASGKSHGRASAPWNWTVPRSARQPRVNAA